MLPNNLILNGTTHLAYQLYVHDIKSKNVVLSKDICKIVGTDSALFNVDENFETISSTIQEYNSKDVRPTDIILDIGANIGGFSLNIYKKVRQVYTVEPLFIDALRKNIELNNAKNIEIIPCALGNGEFEVSYNGRKRKVLGLSLEKIIKLCGGHVDFLKCDCEGGEWCMTLPEILNIRRIEAEIHNFDGTHNFKDFENLLISSGFEYKKRYDIRGTMLISAKNRYIN